MKPTLLRFLTLTSLVDAATICRAQLAFQLSIPQNQFVAGEPKANYSVSYVGDTLPPAKVTISTRCSYRCQNTDGRARDMYVTWTPQMDIYNERSNLVTSSFTQRSDFRLKLPNRAVWSKDNDVFTFSYNFGIGKYRLDSTTTIVEDKTGYESSSGPVSTSVNVGLIV